MLGGAVQGGPVENYIVQGGVPGEVWACTCSRGAVAQSTKYSCPPPSKPPWYPNVLQKFWELSPCPAVASVAANLQQCAVYSAKFHGWVTGGPVESEDVQNGAQNSELEYPPVGGGLGVHLLCNAGKFPFNPRIMSQSCVNFVQKFQVSMFHFLG